jgi:hypothetical protein
MSLYILLLFVHIGGAVCLFSGMGNWLFGLAAIAITPSRPSRVALGRWRYLRSSVSFPVCHF